MTPQTIALVAELRAKREAATKGAWYHYNEVFRSQFSRRRITEIQRDRDGETIIKWTGFDGLSPSMQRRRNHNAALIVDLVNAFPTIADTIEAQAEEITHLTLERDQARGQASMENQRANRLAELIRDCPEARSVWGEKLSEEAAEDVKDLDTSAAEITRLTARCDALEGQVETMEAALRDVRRAILEAPMNIVTDTLWLPEDASPNETAVDRIDAALNPGGDRVEG
jgi:polyhydroxyalkanoate synthesis regulator phasin